MRRRPHVDPVAHRHCAPDFPVPGPQQRVCRALSLCPLRPLLCSRPSAPPNDNNPGAVSTAATPAPVAVPAPSAPPPPVKVEGPWDGSSSSSTTKLPLFAPSSPPVPDLRKIFGMSFETIADQEASWNDDPPPAPAPEAPPVSFKDAVLKLMYDNQQPYRHGEWERQSWARRAYDRIECVPDRRRAEAHPRPSSALQPLSQAAAQWPMPPGGGVREKKSLRG